MALDSNIMLGRMPPPPPPPPPPSPPPPPPLPHFSPHPVPQLAGGNLFSQNLLEFENLSNPYVFPPLRLVGPVLKFLYSFRIPCTIVVLQLSHYSYWWPELMLGLKSGFSWMDVMPRVLFLLPLRVDTCR